MCSNSGDWSFCYNDDGTIRADRYLELGSCNAAARSMIGQSDRIIGGDLSATVRLGVIAITHQNQWEQRKFLINNVVDLHMGIQQIEMEYLKVSVLETEEVFVQ